MPTSKRAALAAVVAVAAAAATHGACLWADFGGDDDIIVFENPYVRLPVSIWHFFLPGGPPQREQIAFRPLTALTFRWDYKMAGLSASFFHATNLGLHLANTALVAVLARSLGAPLPVVGVSAFLVALHPALAEATQVISHREELLSLSFCLLAATVYVSRSFSARGRLGLVLLFYELALLSKEMTAVLAVVLLACRFTVHRRRRTPLVPVGVEIAGYVLCVALFAALRYNARPNAGMLAFLPKHQPLWERPLLVLRTFGDYT